MEHQLFKTAYAGLNPEQKSAVDAIEGPVMVIAGPGTGKTQILTLRIANILLQTDTKPENILALTFTEAGAKAMRERLRKYIGAVAYRVSMYTFHGFAEMLIRSYPDAFPRIIGGRPASDLDKVRIIEAILENPDIKKLRPMGDSTYYVDAIIRMLGTLKKEYVTPDTLGEIIARSEEDLGATQKIHEKGAHKGKVRGEYQKKEQTLEKNRELLYVYRAYEAMLRTERLYDFEDMIIEAVRALSEQEDFLRELQETYQYILADEHQDVNGSQNKILELLASFHESPNLFVVGDEKQAIFRFQGASLENFLYFEDAFQGTTTIALTENYRSGQTILDGAHSLVRVEDGPLKELRVPLHAQKGSKAEIFESTFSHEAVEDSALITSVQKNIADGTPLNEIAIIVRTNKEVEHFADLLHKVHVPVHATADSDILHHPLFRAMRNLIELVANPTSEENLFRVLHASYWGIATDDLIKIVSHKSYDHTLSSIVHDTDILREIGVENIPVVQNVLKVQAEARQRELTEAPHRVLEYLLEESGFLRQVIEQDAIGSRRVVRRMYDEVEGMVQRDGITTLRDIQTHLDLRSAHGLPLTAPYIETNDMAVQVMTAHKSKGLEFEHVYIPHLTDNAWGGRTRRESFKIPLTKHLKDDVVDELDDERRLLYVAMTRAKVGLHMSFSTRNGDGKELSPSRLLEDIDETVLTKLDVADEETSFDSLRDLAPLSAPLYFNPDFLRTTLAQRGLSATALNNYLKSPWNYFYRNMLRIPEVQSLTMQYGTVLHAVMEQVTKYNTKNQKLPSDSEIKLHLERQLGKLPITKEEFTRLHERGMKALFTYIPYSAPALPKRTYEEFSIKVALPTGDSEIPEILLTGKLDRLDFDDEGKVTHVVDYKTGKPKTRGYIEGTTKDSTGDYKRQLTFYALLLSLYEDEKYFCRTGLLTFLEADDKGKIHEELFIITDEEISALKEEVIRVGLEIARGTFLAKPCDPEQSSYCDLVAEMQVRQGK